MAETQLAAPDISDITKDGKYDQDLIDRMNDKLSARDRLLLMVRSSLLLDHTTRESEMIHNAMIIGAGCGMAMGLFYKSTKFTQDFVRNYNDAVFENKYLAKRKYLDNFLYSGFKSGTSYALKVSLLGGASCGALLVPMTIRDEEYRISDATLGMGLVFGLSRLALGMKAVGVGAALGMGLGALSGTLVKIYLNLTGVTPKEMRYWNQKMYVDKKKKQKVVFDDRYVMVGRSTRLF